MSREKRKDEPIELELSRTFVAPVAKVFKAWTDPRQLAQWWGPKGFTNPQCEVDARPEGAISIAMTGPDGVVYPLRGIFHEVIKNVKISFSMYAFDDDRRRAGLVTHITVTFSEEDGITTITILVRVVRAAPEVANAVAGMRQGWGESLDRLGLLFTNNK